MSKPVKQMIIDLYREQFGEVSDARVVDVRGLKSNENNSLRGDLQGKGIKVTVVKNALARLALKETGLEPLNDMLEGPSAIVTGGESVVNIARELIDYAKKIENLELKGAVMEGTVFGAGEIDALSKYPTKDEAQAQVIQVILGPAGQVIGAATSAGANLASLLSAVEEKLEGAAEDATVASLAG